MNDLASLQEWMLATITNPNGIGIAVEHAVAPSATLTAAERMAIYNRSYFARLLECLQSMFPALRHALGDTLFHRFAVGYLDAHPPSGPSLDALADRFPDYLEATRPDAAEPEAWVEFVIELARLELAFVQVFTGEGVEELDERALDILSLTPADLRALRLAPAPSLRLFSCRFPVHDYLTAVRLDQKPPLPAPKPSRFAVTRRDYRVYTHDLAAGEFAILSAVDGSRTIAEIAPHHEPAILAVSIADWLRKGYVVRDISSSAAG